MAGLLDKLTKTAVDAANMASNKAEELMEVNRLKNQQNGFKSDLSAVKRKLGDYCYTMYQDGKIDDETVVRLCGEIDELNDKVEELDEKIADTRAGYRAKSSDDDGERL